MTSFIYPPEATEGDPYDTSVKVFKASRIYAPTWSVHGRRFDGMAPYHQFTSEYGRDLAFNMVEKETGWVPQSKPRTNRNARPGAQWGSYRGVTAREERIVTLEGKTYAQNRVARERAELWLYALCSDTRGLYEMRRVADQSDQVLHVELDDEPLYEIVNENCFSWSFQFAAPDPRKHDYLWQEIATGQITGGVGGLDFGDPDTGLGLDFSGAGLNFGTELSQPNAQVYNQGSAPAYPLFTLTGPLSRPEIWHLELGTYLRCADDIAAGEVVYVNCDAFPQKDIPGRTALSTTRGNIASLFITPNGWPEVGRNTAATFELRSGGPVGSGMSISFRGAWA